MALFIFIIIFVTVGALIVKETIKKDKPQQITQQQISFGAKRLRYFCIKDKGYHVSVWPKDAGIQNLDYIEFDIAGMSHRENIDDYLGEHSGTLVSEPTNYYDPNAIKILASDSHHVGYVPKDMTAEVRKHTQLPCKCYFYIGENDGTYFSDCYIKI